METMMYVPKQPIILALALLASSSYTANATADTTFVTDQGHTEIIFNWSHAGVSTQGAEFDKAVGTLNLADDIEQSSVNVVIDTTSLSSGFAALDKHLKSEDFLEVETYPEITFVSTSVTKTGDTTLNVEGDLTIHGVTKAITLMAEITHQGPHPLGKAVDYYKGDWIAFKATTQIDHQAFNVGGFSTGPISILINTEMKAK